MNKKVIYIFFEQPFHFSTHWRRLLILSLVIFSFLGSAGEAFAQITLRSESSSFSNDDLDLIINRPTGLTEGDLMIASILQSSNNDENLSNATATGWLLVDGRQINAGTPDDRWYGTVLYKVATSADVLAANFTFARGNTETDDMVGIIMAFSGVDVTGGFDADGNPGTGPFDIDPGVLGPRIDSDVLNASSITTVSDNAAVVMIGMVTDDRTFSNWDTTSPGALTEISEQNDNDGEPLATGTAWAIKPTAGATGAGTADLNGGSSDESMSMLLALKPIPDGPVSSCGEAIYITPGLQTFYVPAGVTSITIETWGAGGRGSTRITQTGRGSGGGGGAYSSSTITVTPGEPIAVHVGAGSTSESPGDSSWVARTESETDALVLAVGGESGLDDSGGNDPGNGGDASSGIGDIRFSGGNGISRGGGENGGGGSSAGNAADGNDATTARPAGATAPAGGGDGGNGGPDTGNTSAGLPGQQPGGGGGGGERRGGGGPGEGGAGGDGQVRITYTCPSYPPCSRLIDDGTISGTTLIEFFNDCTWDAPEGLLEFEVLVVGGGGGGGFKAGGGGGNGGLVHARANYEVIEDEGLPANSSFAIIVGDGGIGSSTQQIRGGDGVQSSFDLGESYEIIAGGGGGGGSDDGAGNFNQGSTGGVSSFATTTGFSIVSSRLFDASDGGASHDRENNPVGSSGGDAGEHAGGGGGGVASFGEDAPNDENGGDGGNGLLITEFDNRIFAAGGGGGARTGAAGDGGIGGGGNGGEGENEDATSGQAGQTPGSGGGGGGDGTTSQAPSITGGNGADGIVFVRYDNFRILPVEWAYFEGRHNRINRSNELLWGTHKEWENSHFDIERSINTVNAWNTIGQIEGAGYSDGPQDYNFTDSILPLSGGNIFYRIKQVDFDGDSTYSETRAIQVEPMTGTTQWRVFPNPTSGSPISIELLDPSAYRDEQLTLRVISPIGQYEFIQVNEIQEMGTQVSKYFEGKSSGVYTLEISWGIHREYHKVILRK